MSRLIPSREAMEDFVILLKRYLSSCRLCLQEDVNRRLANEFCLSSILEPYPPQLGLAQKVLLHELRGRLATSDFLVPFGWPDHVNQALETVRSGGLYYDATRFRDKGGVVTELIPTFADDEAVGLKIVRMRKRKTKKVGTVFSPSKAEAMLAGLESLIGDLETAARDGTGVTGEPTPPVEREADRQIIETLRGVGRRLTTRTLLSAMDKQGLIPGESTVKKRLAVMVKDGRLTKDPKARPRGYGLPEWSGGSSGSVGS